MPQPRVARAVATRLPPGWGLFLGNSMPIRDMDMYAWAPRDDSATSPGASLTASGPGVPVAANRGASGIDGVLSTAVGYAQGLGRGVTLVVGDVSALHDTNGLALLQEARGRPPVVVVLVNNGGGAIFSFLPVAGAIPRDVFETVFATPPNTRFADLLKAHGVAHRLVAHADALPAVLDEAWSLGAHCVVEVLTDRESNLDIHRAIQDRARATARAACAHLFPPHAPATHSLVPTALPLAVGPAPGLAGTMAGGMGIGTSLGQLRLRCLRYSVPLARPVTTGAKDSQRTGVLIECTIGDAEHSTGAGAGGNADVGGRGVEGLASKAGPHWNGSSKAGAATAAVDGGKPTLSGAATAAGLGEVSPLPGLHQETWAEAAAQSELVCRLLDGKHLPASAVLSLHGPLRWVEDASGVRVADLAPSVRCGLEAALLTAAANRLGTTVAALLGAAAGVSGVQGYEDVRVNGLVSEADPDKAAQAALDLAERGFQCIKVKVGRGDVASDVAAVHAVRAAVPAGVALRADANRAWGRDEAEAFMRGVADVGLEYLEEPTQVRHCTMLFGPCTAPALRLIVSIHLSARFCMACSAARHSDTSPPLLFAGPRADPGPGEGHGRPCGARRDGGRRRAGCRAGRLCGAVRERSRGAVGLRRIAGTVDGVGSKGARPPRPVCVGAETERAGRPPRCYGRGSSHKAAVGGPCARGRERGV